MGIFNFWKSNVPAREEPRSFSQAILAGDIRGVQKMLEAGADPNQCDANDSSRPIFYAVNSGPQMVQLLIDHGADVNAVSRGKTPLTLAEARGLTDVAGILREAGAKLRAPDDDRPMDSRISLQLVQELSLMVVKAKHKFPGESPEVIAAKIEPLVDYPYPSGMSPQQREKIQSEIRDLIRQQCRDVLD